MIRIFYGVSSSNNVIDVTDICFSKLNNNDIITIPAGEYIRAKYFTDPIVGVLKKIIIQNNGTVTEYDKYTEIKINTTNNIITTINKKYTDDKITQLHSKLILKYGTFRQELPEQKIAIKYLTGNEKVLEIGGNIGRNSLIIASILNNSTNLVTLECNTNIAKQLTENRDLNGLQFHIENSALSNRKLIQRSWITKPSDKLLEGYSWVNTITLNQLKSKYNIKFDTLVIDCEGAFYYILIDMPDILNNIKLIIMENDYWDISHKNYIDDVLKQNGFYVDYKESGGWGPCFDNFYEAWKKL